MLVNPPTVVTAEFVVPAGNLRETIDHFVTELGFRVANISPADAPVTAALVGHGVRVRLDPMASEPGELRLGCRPVDEPRSLPEASTAPNGTRIVWFDAEPPVVVPRADQALVVARRPNADESGVGRAGMLYHDLLPGRHGGAFIASHISIPGGGPVPDYVHFHHIRFQMIFCRAGWVRVAYEDQGEAIVMQPGDCVLQPPGIRHRVLEASVGLEVVEIASPAHHQTFADLDLVLPTGRVEPDREFGGQRFVHHVAAEAGWSRWRHEGYEWSDFGLGTATGGIALVGSVRAAGARATPWDSHRHEFAFWHVLEGSVRLAVEGDDDAEVLGSGDSVTVPAGLRHRLVDGSHDLRLLEVVVPA